MPLFAPQQIERYADQANQMPGLPARQTVQSVDGSQQGQDPQLQSSNRSLGLPWRYKAGMIGANMGDAISTRMALSSNPNTHEGNGIMNKVVQSTPATLAMKGGTGLLESYIMDKLSKDHPKLARGLSIAAMSLPGFATVNNLSKVK
jgi:hypothetical protein